MFSADRPAEFVRTVQANITACHYDDASVYIKMTLTSPACPVAGILPGEVEQKVAGVQGVKSAKVEITFEPAWDRTMMSEAAQLELGFM